MTDKEWNDAFAAANPDCWIHDLATGEIIPPLNMRNDDIDDLCPSDYRHPWPPTEEEIEMMEWLKEQEDLDRSIPDARERNRNLK